MRALRVIGEKARTRAAEAFLHPRRDGVQPRASVSSGLPPSDAVASVEQHVVAAADRAQLRRAAAASWWRVAPARSAAGADKYV